MDPPFWSSFGCAGWPESAILQALGRRLHLRARVLPFGIIINGLAIGKEDQAAAAAAAA